PEALVEFGIAETSRPGRTKDEWRELLESRLAETQSSLAQKSQARDHAAFDVLIDGSAGIGGFYEWVRRVRSTVSGKSYTPRHRDVCKEETS
ncbi:MAG: acyltransferase, partial [Planctomycetota bacterium]